MTEKEREIALYCLKANSDYHSEVCEECINYPNCDHTIQDDVTETIIKTLEQQEWIPVSKKLPKAGQAVYVTCYGRVGVAIMNSKSGNPDKPVFWLFRSDDKVPWIVSEEYTTNRISAWMPMDIPEPYVPKAESEG